MNQVQHRLQREIRKQVDIHYLLYLPDKYGDDKSVKWPLLLFLHGAGERGNDIKLVKRHGPPYLIDNGKAFPFVIVSPQCPQNSMWEMETDAVIAMLDELIATHNIDESKVYVTGLSMGGSGAWNLAADYPNKFAAIAPICSGGNLEKSKQLKHTPIWAFHGENDDVTPVKQAQEMVKAVEASGGSAKLTVYPNTKHNSWTKTYNNPELYQWLLSHSKPANKTNS
ncbi:prolyl oligopeptidase family serine peptidase [Paenibacillus sp. S-12]|uniref:carboxylesterase family protein n=1 Tax=Paenibacillus sp. S-12 TaxID=3031371 RepID=UPI0025A0FC1C|nr:prolyl oligopeptidase family serine peptidase [Paenibacillus sp. S-12]